MTWTQEDFNEMRKDWGNNTLVGWKLIYTDGSCVRSTDMEFRDAPQRGVQVLIKYYKRAKGGYSREIQNGLDLYILYSNQAEKMVVRKDIKLGANIENFRFDGLLAAARIDDEVVVGLKSGDVYRED